MAGNVFQAVMQAIGEAGKGTSKAFGNAADLGSGKKEVTDIDWSSPNGGHTAAAGALKGYTNGAVDMTPEGKDSGAGGGDMMSMISSFKGGGSGAGASGGATMSDERLKDIYEPTENPMVERERKYRESRAQLDELLEYRKDLERRFKNSNDPKVQAEKNSLNIAIRDLQEQITASDAEDWYDYYQSFKPRYDSFMKQESPDPRMQKMLQQELRGIHNNLHDKGYYIDSINGRLNEYKYAKKDWEDYQFRMKKLRESQKALGRDTTILDEELGRVGEILGELDTRSYNKQIRDLYNSAKGTEGYDPVELRKIEKELEQSNKGMDSIFDRYMSDGRLKDECYTNGKCLEGATGPNHTIGRDPNYQKPNLPIGRTSPKVQNTFPGHGIGNTEDSPILKAFESLDAIMYKYNNKAQNIDDQTGSIDQDLHTGIRAQDLEKTPAFQSAVQTEPNGYKSVDTREMTLANTAGLSEVVKKLQEVIDQVNALEGSK